MGEKQAQIDFFLVGAAKCGTTSLSDWLKVHPKIFIPQIKETNYFSTDIKVEKFNRFYEQNTFLDLDSYFADEELEPLHISFVQKREQLNRLYKDAPPDSIRGECSTSHLYSIAAANNIRSFNDQSKIIIILRDPIERAFSHYLMARKYGFTNLDFRSAVKKDLSVRKKGWGISELFVDLGLYSKQIQRYQDNFPAGQILIVPFEELRDQAQKTYNNICLFLGVQIATLPNQQQLNQAAMPRMNKLNLWLTQSGVKKDLGKLIPTNLKERVKKFYYTDVNLPSLTNEDRKFMLDIFREDIERTERITGMDLSDWLK